MDCSCFLNAVIAVSEKAANIARICRQDKDLLNLLIREKNESEKNPRFFHDFKTLADVLVQEVVKHDLGSKFSNLIGNIYGEESNEFSIGDEIVIVEIKENLKEMENLLFKLIQNQEASSVLSNILLSEIEINEKNSFTLPDNIGIWIDPIDSTGEYIQGGIVEGDLIKSGLPCVTVLIGVFDLKTGVPVLGVVNQPFYQLINEEWKGRYFYGIPNGVSFPIYPEKTTKLIAISASEDDKLKQQLRKNGFQTIELAGAGYKLLNVIMSHVDAYVLTKPTTFYWDVCACNAILNSIGGGVIGYNTLKPLTYMPDKDNCNKDGIIAYRKNEIKNRILEIINTP